MSAPEPKTTLPAGVLRVRSGPGANCSSIGSAVDILFVAAVAGGVVFVVASAIAKLGGTPSGEGEQNPGDGEEGGDTR